MAWSRELGRRSQEFKMAKNSMLTKNIGPPEPALPDLPNTQNKPEETSKQNSTLIYLILIGGVVVLGAYYSINMYKQMQVKTKDLPKVEPIEKPKVTPKLSTNLVNME